MINEFLYAHTHPNQVNTTPGFSEAISVGRYPIIGRSEAMTRVKKQIEFASSLSYVIFVSGENGCEKNTIAWYIHHLSREKSGNFISIPANINEALSYKAYILKSIQLAQNGTLCIEDIDCLPIDKRDELISLFTLDGFTQKLKVNNIRLIISCTSRLNDPQNTQYIAELLGSSIPQFNFHLPPLRERSEDIDDHVGFILSNLKTNVHVSDAALELLKQYDWPGNLSELQRLILFLASFCDNKITVEDVVSLGIIKDDQPKTKDNIVDYILEQNIDHFKNMHPSLFKALRFLSNHFLEDICLDQLASAAFTSVSHLSYLFRRHLQTTFKSLLNQSRVRFSKNLIDQSPTSSITEICLQSGFGDLSHFEKMFKRYIGCTPRQYRSKQRQRKKYASS